MLLVGLLAVVAFVVISVNIDATPDKNDGDDTPYAGCDDKACHVHPESDWHKWVDMSKPHENLHIDYYNSPGALAVEVRFFSNDSDDMHKLENEWNESQGKWVPITIAAELTETKNQDNAKVYYTAKADGTAVLTLYAPDGGKWKVRAGYYNISKEELYYTDFEVDVDYVNKQPVAKASFTGFPDFEILSGGVGEEDAVVRFNEEGKGAIYFSSKDSTDPDEDDVANLSYCWDFNDKINADSSGEFTDDNDTGPTGETDPGDEIFFYNKNHPDWKYNTEIDEKRKFKPDETYTITLAVTDNHLVNHWDIDTLTIKFEEALVYPDLNVGYATIEPNEVERGNPVKIIVKIRNDGERDLTADDGPFLISFKTVKDRIKIIDDQEINLKTDETIQVGKDMTFEFDWIDTTYFFEDHTEVAIDKYDLEVEVDVENKITETDEGNNVYTTTGGAIEIIENETGNIKLEITTFNFNTTAASEGYTIDEDEKVYINVTIKNTGTEDAQYVKVYIYDKTEANPNPETSSYNEEIEIILPGKEKTISYLWVASVTGGEDKEEHSIFIMVEYADENYNTQYVNDTGKINVNKVEDLKYLFSLSLDYKKYMKEGNVGEELHKVFKDNNYPLSGNAKIYIINDKKWEIRDGDKTYIIKDTGNELDIYEGSASVEPSDNGDDDLFNKLLIPLGAVVAIVVAVVVVVSVRSRKY